ETDKQFKETDKQFKETDKRIKKLNDLFTSQWGKLIESLVEGDLIALLNAKGIMVERTQERVKGSHRGNPYEFDIIASNGVAVVVVEVKTTLRPNDVKHFKAKLAQVKTLISDYEHKTIYGAMAYLKADAGSAAMAENQGLFIIKATGSSASIANSADFEPKAF
ncbi:MAG: hypothetical protein LAT76_12090, partial [Schleiferiaceae bacterium]|nr:hypothetical protein [Schleiferiaceae bacterium]